MNRFNTPEEVKEWAAKAAAEDYERHIKYDIDLNPFFTPGARNDWQRGFDNLGPRSYESPDILLWDTVYLRGRAVAELLEKIERGGE